MGETMPTPHACIKGVPGVCAGQGPPHSSHLALLATVSLATLRESPVPCAPFIPHTLSLGEQQSFTVKPRTHVRPPQPQGYRVGLAPRARRGPGSQAAGIQGCGRLDRRGSRLQDSSRPALLGCRATHFRVVTETFCSL